MWKAIESLKNKKADICLSAGNTGALLVVSRLLLKTIEGINKPALAALWPNEKSMNVVLSLSNGSLGRALNIVNNNIFFEKKVVYSQDKPPRALGH